MSKTAHRVVLLALLALAVFTYEFRQADAPQRFAVANCINADELPNMIPIELPHSVDEFRKLLHAGVDCQFNASVRRLRNNLEWDRYFLFAYPVAALLAVIWCVWKMYPPKLVGPALALAAAASIVATGVCDHWENAGIADTIDCGEQHQAPDIDAMKTATRWKWGLLGLSMLLLAALEWQRSTGLGWLPGD